MHRFCIAVFVVGVTVSAHAQNVPAVDVAGSYSLLKQRYTSGGFQGWVASATRNINPVLGITGEIGGSYRTDLFGRVDLHSFLGGLRVASRREAGVTPYASVVLGPVRGNRTYFSLQPGAGVDFWFRPRLGIRAGGDYRWVFTKGEVAEQLRFHLGVVLAAGSR